MLTWHSLLAVLHFCHQIAGSNARCFWKWRCMDLHADTNMKANQERLLALARQASSVLRWHQSVLGATFSGMGGHEAPHVWISLEPGLKHTWHMMLCNMKSMQVNFGAPLDQLPASLPPVMLVVAPMVGCQWCCLVGQMLGGAAAQLVAYVPLPFRVCLGESGHLVFSPVLNGLCGGLAGGWLLLWLLLAGSACCCWCSEKFRFGI